MKEKLVAHMSWCVAHVSDKFVFARRLLVCFYLPRYSRPLMLFGFNPEGSGNSE